MARRRIPRTRPRRSGTLQKILWVVLALVVVFAATAVVILTSTDLVEEQVRKVILEQASRSVDARISIRSVELNYLPLRVVANDVAVEHPSEGSLLEAETLEVEVDVISLLTDEIHLTEVALVRPSAEVRLVEGRMVNLPRILETSGGPAVILESLNVSDGTVHLTAEDTAPWPVEASIGNLSVDVTGDGNKVFEVRLLAGRGEIAAGDVNRTLDRMEIRTTLDTRRKELESRIKYVHLEMLDVKLSVEDGTFELDEDGAVAAAGEFVVGAPLGVASRLLDELPDMEGTVECLGDGAYSPGGFSVDADCSGREIRVGRSFIGDVDLHALATDREVIVSGGSVRQAGGELTFDATLALASESMDVVFKGDADGLRFADLATNVGLKHTRVQFSVRGPIEAAGTLAPLDIAGNLDWTVNGFRVGTERFRDGLGRDVVRVGPSRLRSAISVDDEAFRFENALVASGATTLRTSVDIGFDNDLRVRVDSNRFNLGDVQVTGLEMKGRGSLHVTVGGSLERGGAPIEVDSRLDFKGLEVAGVEFGHVRTRLTSNTRREVIDIVNAVGTLGESRYRIPDTRVTFRPRRRGGILVEGTVAAETFHAPDLRRAFDLDGDDTWDAEGVFRGEVTFSVEPNRGSDRLRLDAEGDVLGLSVAGQPVGGGHVSLRYDMGRLEVRELVMSDGTSRLDIQGVADPEAGIDMDVHLADLDSSSIALVDMERLGLGFGVDLDGHIGGTYENPIVEGAVLLARDLHYKGQRLGDSAFEIDLADGELRIAGPVADGLILFESSTRTGGSYETHVRIDVDGLVLDQGPLGVSELTEARARVAGTIEGTLHLAGPFRAQGNVRLESVVLQVPDYGIHNDGPVTASFSHKGLFMDRVEFVGEGTSIRITGSLGREGPRLQVNGRTDLALIARFVRQLSGAQGTVTPSVGIEGTWQSIDVGGEVDVDAKKLGITGVPLQITDMVGSATFNEGSMVVDAAGDVAGGRFTASGGIDLEGFVPRGYDVHADFNDVTVRIIDDTPMGIEGRLALQGGAEGALPVLSGDVWVTRFRYTEDIRLASLEDIGVVKPTAAVKTYAQEDDHIRLDVMLHGYENLEVENNLADVTFRIDETQRQFRLVGTDARPLLSGAIMVTRGTVTYQKKTFEVTRGLLQFDSTTRIDPHIDIIAVGEVRDWRLTLHATGTYSDLKVLLSSDPPLSDEDIVCLLATDMTCEEATEGLGAIGALGLNQILGEFSDIEQFKVVPVYDPDTGHAEPMVLLEQKVTEKISVSALSSLGANEESGRSAYLKATVAYKVNENLSIEGFYDTKGAGKGSNVGNVGLELSWRIEF